MHLLACKALSKKEKKKKSSKISEERRAQVGHICSTTTSRVDSHQRVLHPSLLRPGPCGIFLPFCWAFASRMMCGARHLRKLAAWFFFLFFYFFLLLLTMSMSHGEHELVHVKTEDPYSSPMSGRGGGGEEQRLSRVGSRPPCCVCERRCGGCAPCTAVQVRAAGRVGVGTQCANYEPVRWKCRCGDTVFEP